jgi:hypothetical protein
VNIANEVIIFALSFLNTLNPECIEEILVVNKLFDLSRLTDPDVRNQIVAFVLTG